MKSMSQSKGGHTSSLACFLKVASRTSKLSRAYQEATEWPDNEQVLDRWAKQFQVFARNVFALISNVGEDCAGAIQFVAPDRLEVRRSGGDDKTEWLDEAEIAKRLQALREDHAAWRLPRDTGQFSLAGAQPKTALLFKKGRWGIPSGLSKSQIAFGEGANLHLLPRCRQSFKSLSFSVRAKANARGLDGTKDPCPIELKCQGFSASRPGRRFPRRDVR